MIELDVSRDRYGAGVDPTLWAGNIAVGVVALFVQGRQNRVSTQAAADQNRLALAAAEQANRDTQAAAARAELWARFHWAVEAVSQSGNPSSRKPGGWS